MLPPAHRLRRPEQFRAVLRARHGEHRLPRGRAGGDLMTVHLIHRSSEIEPEQMLPRVGFVVGKSVGNSVVRHRTQRRLRHVIAGRLHELPVRCDVVVRAQPASATASSQELGIELDRLLARALGQLERVQGRRR